MNDDTDLRTLIKLMLQNIENIQVDPMMSSQDKAFSSAKLGAVVVDAEELIRQDNEINYVRYTNYEDHPCDDCGKLTIVKNGTYLKCNTCGWTKE